jgi:TPR repeat protein
VDEYLSKYLNKSPGRPWPEPQVLVHLAKYFQTGQGQLLPDPYMRQKILSEVFSRVRRHEETGENPTGSNLRGAWCLFGRALVAGSDGLDADPDRGVKYLLQSGTTDAFYHLGRHYSQVSSIDTHKALQNFLKAANANHPGALFELGRRQLDRDAKESYLKKAADANHKGAQSMLAMLYLEDPDRDASDSVIDRFTGVAEAGLGYPSDTSPEVVSACLNMGSSSMCQSVSPQNPTMLRDLHEAMKVGDDESMAKLEKIQAAEVLAGNISESPGIQWQYFQDKIAYAQAALFWFSAAALVGGDHNAYASALECLVVGCCSGVGQHPSVVFERILRKFVSLNPEKKVLERIFAQIEMVDLGVDVPYLRLVSGLSAGPIMELYRRGDEKAIFNLAQQSFRLETNSFDKGFRLLLHAAKKGHEEAQAWAKRLNKYPDDKFKELLCCPRTRQKFCEALTQQAVSAELSQFYPEYRHHGEVRYVRRHLMCWQPNTGPPTKKKKKKKTKPRGLKKLVDDRLRSSCGYCYREEEPGEQFSACGRCRVVYYCSVRCQKQHWFHTLVSHKNTCQAHGRSPVVRALDPRGSLCYLLSSWMKIDIPDGIQEFCIG